MNILFLSISSFDSIYQHSLYPDLLREFMKQGHEVYVVGAVEKRANKETSLTQEDHCHLLKVKVGNITKSHIIEKGIATVLIGRQYERAIADYFKGVKFDLILYATPPITLAGTIAHIKKRDNARTYLLLKDIFPQNAVDIGMLRTTGIKGALYWYFRRKEKKLYAASDRIGCMSQANADYVLRHNPEISKDRVEVCPNCVDILDKSVDAAARKDIRQKYNIPLDKTVFVYGGNLGKPQGIDFLIQCLRSQKDNADAFFLVVGDGTEYGRLETFVTTEKPGNVRLMKRLPKEDYDTMVGACDVGMIFLDHRFTIPNFPSRLLSYMQAQIPVLACTDPNTDIGQVITGGGFGWWCESNDTAAFAALVEKAASQDLPALGRNGMKYLREHYSVQDAYKTILQSLEK